MDIRTVGAAFSVNLLSMNQPKRVGRVLASVFASTLVLSMAVGCDEEKPGLEAEAEEAEKMPEIRPNLPKVPKLKKPEFPVQYADGSYSVFGLRKRIQQLMDTDLKVTGYIVDIYEPPECPRGQECPQPKVPHVWIADKAGEREFVRKLQVVGYAERHKQVEQARASAGGKTCVPENPKEGEVPIPADFEVGNKVRVSGHFARISASGFNTSEGLIEYKECHETLEKAAGGE